VRALLFLFAMAAAAQTGPAYRFVNEVDASGHATLAGLGTDAAGETFVVSNTASGPSIVKLDPNGNILSRTAFGDSNVQANAVAVDAAGNVYIAGLTHASTFPTTKGAWLTTSPATTNGYLGVTFLLRLNPDGSLGFSTYFSDGATVPNAVALGPDGSVYLAGNAAFPANLPVTPGAYKSTCGCGFIPTGFFAIPDYDGFLARFDATGSQLLFATYLGLSGVEGAVAGRALAVASDGSAYLGGQGGVYRLNSAGSALLASTMPPLTVQALTLGPDGSVYLGGIPTPYHSPAPSLPSQGSGTTDVILRLDASLADVLNTNYFGSLYGTQIAAMTTDASGNLYVAGSTVPYGLPTAAPLAQGFGLPETGFLSKFSPDLSSLQFSSYLGDTEYFGLSGIALGLNGDVIVGGATTNQSTAPPPPGNVWVNSLILSPPPALRIDSVLNAASQLAVPLSGGEAIVVNGAGFTAGAQVLVGGTAAKVLSIEPSQIVAAVPGLSGTYATVAVQSGGASSNSLLVPIASTSPGIYSQDGTGYGQGYIVNQDGSLNAPSHPASPGDRITLYATGIGPVNFIGPYAQTTTPVTVLIDGFYCNGVAAVIGPVTGLPGDVYQLTVYVPTAPKIPPQSGITLRVAGGVSQNWLAISIAQ
jgi:uncharacterized protein (TIGR03437 family)